MEIGEKIKKLRTILGLTQEELADRAELTKGFISQVERDLTSPSIASLSDILEALGTNLSEFFKNVEDEKFVFKEKDMFVAINEENFCTLKWVVPNSQKNSMEPILVVLEAKGSTREYAPYEGEDFGYVLKGEIILHMDDNSYELKAGECFYTKCNTNRYLENIKDTQAEVLWITNPPNF